MVFTKLSLENALVIWLRNCEAASEPLLPKVARCIPVLSSGHIGKCTARVLKRSGSPYGAKWRPGRWGWNEQQQQQTANHSSDNAEITRCLTPFSYPGTDPLDADVKSVLTGLAFTSTIVIYHADWFQSNQHSHETGVFNPIMSSYVL